MSMKLLYPSIKQLSISQSFFPHYLHCYANFKQTLPLPFFTLADTIKRLEMLM